MKRSAGEPAGGGRAGKRARRGGGGGGIVAGVVRAGDAAADPMRAVVHPVRPRGGGPARPYKAYVEEALPAAAVPDASPSLIGKFRAYTRSFASGWEDTVGTAQGEGVVLGPSRRPDYPAGTGVDNFGSRVFNGTQTAQMQVGPRAGVMHAPGVVVGTGGAGGAAPRDDWGADAPSPFSQTWSPLPNLLITRSVRGALSAMRRYDPLLGSAAHADGEIIPNVLTHPWEDTPEASTVVPYAPVYAGVADAVSFTLRNYRRYPPVNSLFLRSSLFAFPEVRTRTHTRAHTRTHAHTRTRTHTHTHARRREWALSEATGSQSPSTALWNSPSM